MAQRRDVTAHLSPFLADYQRRMLRLRAELAAAPSLTTWEDPPLDLGAVLDPVTRAIEEAATAIAARPQLRSRRATLNGELSVLWADVIETEPSRLQRQWGHRDVPDAWSETQRRLLAAVDEAQRRSRPG